MNNTVIAIDGPAGAGKSTVAKKIAEQLNFLYLDSGALFRAITYKVMKMGITIDDENSIIEIANNTKIEFIDNIVFLDGQDVNKEIRSNTINVNVSYVAKIPKVREIVVDIERSIASNRSVVVDGRDIGTTVFPDAFIKFYMIASVEERAKRRLKELNASSNNYAFEEIKNQIIERDNIDSNRSVSPLKKADDAILIVTDGKSIEQVVADMLYKISIKGEKNVIQNS